MTCLVICVTGLLLFYTVRAYPDQEDQLFGDIDPFTYLTGRFVPLKHKLFCRVDGKKIPTKNNYQMLRCEAAAALQKMYEAFRKDHPGVPFWLQSSTRNYDAQRTIWESKWNKGGAPKKLKEILERGFAILTYSSMPGTSRHHWGTDVDLNVLRNEYYEKGAGAVLYAWLTENAGHYGFCQPYGAGRAKGYAEEKWHWSYRPLSAPMLAKWNEIYEANKESFSKKGLFGGAESLGELAPVYVNEINGDCR